MNVNTATAAELRAEEKRCMKKIVARARKMVAADPSLSIDIARGRAIEQMPNTVGHYLEARSRLTAMGIPPMRFNEIV